MSFSVFRDVNLNNNVDLRLPLAGFNNSLYRPALKQALRLEVGCLSPF